MRGVEPLGHLSHETNPRLKACRRVEASQGASRGITHCDVRPAVELTRLIDVENMVVPNPRLGPALRATAAPVSPWFGHEAT